MSQRISSTPQRRCYYWCSKVPRSSDNNVIRHWHTGIISIHTGKRKNISSQDVYLPYLFAHFIINGVNEDEVQKPFVLQQKRPSSLQGVISCNLRSPVPRCPVLTLPLIITYPPFFLLID